MLLLRSNPSKSCSASVILPASAVYKVLRRSTMFIALRSLIVCAPAERNSYLRAATEGCPYKRFLRCQRLLSFASDQCIVQLW